MNYVQLPVTEDPYQVLYLPASPDGNAFRAKIELRYLPVPDRWFLSVSDAAAGTLFVNQIPVVCSYGELNDLFFPFRWQFRGSGIGSFFCLKAVDVPSSPDPSGNNLNEFRLIWGDRWKE